MADLARQTSKLREGSMLAVFRTVATLGAKKAGGAQMERLAQSSIQDEIGRQEQLIHLLATIGNIAPFIGLFGTVWGIMNAFQEIGRQGTANIAAVGPGVAEALVTTAAGLLVAIPAVAAYNMFANTLREVELQMQLFLTDLLAWVENQSSAAPIR